MATLIDKLTALATLSPAQLREAWQEGFGAAAPSISPTLLRHALAYQLQEQTHGGLPASTQRILDALRAGATPAEPAIRLKPGTRLLREWNGTVHAVLVADDGLVFDERRFSSLSEVAKEITGAHWSGPRFFGLKRPINPPRQGVSLDG